MRFLYIDSQGKEVPIPTVDALALRIELGAITETTRFYDANADRWAPAGEHEIFRSLTRELADKSGGFVAPPPVAPLPVPRPWAPAPEPPARSRAPNPFEALEGPAEEAFPAAAPPAEPAPPSGKVGGNDDLLGSLDFGLTLEDPPAEFLPGPAAERSDSDPFGVEMTPMAAPEPTPEPAAVTPPANSFDFGGFGGMLTESEDDDEDEEEPAAAPAPGNLGLEGAMTGGSYDPSIQAQVDRVAPGGGRDGMAMEQSLSEMALDEGSWMQKEPEFEQEAKPAEPSPPQRFRADDDEPPTDRKDRPERPARPRPAAPPPPEKSGAPALIGLVVVIALVGAGGWFGWTKFKNREPAEVVEAEVVDPPVSIPDLPEALQPRMRELSSAAKADWLAMLRTQLPAEDGLAAEPDRDWLGGSYLADASKYASIEQYWKGLDVFLRDLQARDEALFITAVGARMDTIAVLDSVNVLSPADREALTNRLRAGFQVGRAGRRAVYRKLQAVIAASLRLHEFLLANEDNITYDPAAGGSSRDPVLEAVPDTPALGNEMWKLVDGITESLDGLGALDRVTTDRLLELVTDQLGAVPIR